MLPQEELKILEQIEHLIQRAGPDSYIRMTFAGVPEICKRNIENDFGDIPVRDLEIERERREKESAEMGAKLLRLEHENQALQTHLDENDDEIAKMGHLYNSKVYECEQWEKNAHDAGDLYAELEAECAEKDKAMEAMSADIVRLKAKLFDYMEREGK